MILDDLALKFELPQFEHFKTEVEEGMYSKSYGMIEKNQHLKIVIDKVNKFPESFIVLIKKSD